jgi:tetratricopeptide (TPR) repeat protein
MNVNQLLTQAKLYEQKGEIEEAIQLYLSILEVYPENKKVIKRLKKLKSTILKNNSIYSKQDEINAVIELYNQGEVRDSLSTSKLLLDKYPNESILYYTNGCCYSSLNQLDNAIDQFKYAINFNPDFIDAHLNLGNAYKELGQLEASADCYEYLLQIESIDAETLNKIGVSLKTIDRLNSAVTAYQKAITINPSFVEAFYNLGIVYNKLGELDDAEKNYKKALKINPNFADAHNNLGNIYKFQEQYDLALEYYVQAIKLNSKYVDALHNQGVVLSKLERLEEAISSFMSALKINPEFYESHYGLGNCYKDLGQYSNAIKSYEKTIALKPDYTEAHYNIAHTNEEHGLVHEAINGYENTLVFDPDYIKARFNLSLLQLGNGFLDEGFKNYEKRWKLEDFPSPKRQFSIPRWQGESLQEKNILLWAEQGIGDEIEFASLIPEFKELGCNVGIECAAKLVELFQWSFPWAEVRETGAVNCEGSEVYALFDYQIPFGSMAPLFRKTLDDFRNFQKPYIPRLKEGEIKVRNKLNLKEEHFLIGVCWRSSNQSTKRSRHYLNVEQLAPLKAIKGAVFLGLQYDDCMPELDRVRRLGLPIHYYTDIDQKNDLASTSALIGACDLVISAGTAVFQISGALGVPTIMFDSHKSKNKPIPWFPTIRHFPLNPDDHLSLINDIINQMPELIVWGNRVTTSERQIDFY